jgi:hypothetical protein
MSKRFAIPLDPSIVAGGATVRALAQAVTERLATLSSTSPFVELVAADRRLRCDK